MEFWYQTRLSWRAMLLSPLSLLVLLVSSLKRRFRSSAVYNVPVVVVGNITVGGTGKTPTINWLAHSLTASGYRVGIVSRGYGAQPNRSFPVEVQPSDSAKIVGDEPKLIFESTGCRVVIDPDRDRAVKFLLSQSSKRPDVIISDDGLQHYKMGRDVEILMVDALRGFGNGWLLPAGPLRESPNRLKTVDFLLAKQSGKFAEQINASIATTRAQPPVNYLDHALEPQSVCAISAIGNPESFVKTLESAGYAVKKSITLPDHADIPKNLLTSSFLPVVVTEKDAVKFKPGFNHKNIYVLPFRLDYESDVENAIIQKIKDRIDEKSRHHSSPV